MEHSAVHVEQGKQLDANHVLVVYNKTKGGDVERRVIQGPTLFIPTAEEWCVCMGLIMSIHAVLNHSFTVLGINVL